jgi:hypothetical protein
MTAPPRRKIVVFDAPSNLGLRPPEAGAPPGCYKLPWALRDRDLVAALGAEDGGALVPPHYSATWNSATEIATRRRSPLTQFGWRTVSAGFSINPLSSSCSVEIAAFFSAILWLCGSAAASPQCAGMEFTIYDPDQDPEGTIAQRIVDFFARRRPPRMTFITRILI